MKIITVIGARPQFIKASAVSRAIREYQQTHTAIQEIIVHTGQHFDKKMSEDFFVELDIPAPDYNLEISGLSHGAMTGRMLEGLETLMLQLKPDAVLVYGDTNSTLAGALAASKLHIPIAHVESGLRSFNRRMPEETNRILTDKLSSLLFCPTQAAVDNLQAEACKEGVHWVGDVMYDSILYYHEKARSLTLEQWALTEGEYVLCTVHREENTNDTERLLSILSALREISKKCKVVWPIHPRTRQVIKKTGNESWLKDFLILEPLSYLQTVRLQMSAQAILTDSGGMQKEAYFNKVPCITLRDDTEWVETVESGWNQLAGADIEKILHAFSCKDEISRSKSGTPYGTGDSARKIVSILQDTL